MVIFIQHTMGLTRLAAHALFGPSVLRTVLDHVHDMFGKFLAFTCYHDVMCGHSTPPAGTELKNPSRFDNGNDCHHTPASKREAANLYGGEGARGRLVLCNTCVLSVHHLALDNKVIIQGYKHARCTANHKHKDQISTSALHCPARGLQ
jgi:hypothetical protein